MDREARQQTAREILDMVRSRLPAEDWQPYPDAAISEDEGGLGVVVMLGDRGYWFDYRTGTPELMVGRLDADGKEACGFVDEDGTIRWGMVMDGRFSPN